MKLLASGVMMFVASCSLVPSSSSSSEDATAGTTTPHLDVQLTDAPASFDAVLVTIAKIEVQRADDSWVTLSDQPQHYDLLTLRDGATALLGGADLAPGMYGQLRLIVSSASVVVAGVETPLTIASGAQTGIKINLDATIEAGVTYTLVLDYDAAKSVKLVGKGYLMTPVIKVKSLTGTGGAVDAGTGSGSDDAGAGSDTLDASAG